MQFARRLPGGPIAALTSAPLLCDSFRESFRGDGPDKPIRPPPLGVGSKSRLVFTGSGNSTGTPRPRCCLQTPDDPECSVSIQAMAGTPDRNRNYRGNPGMLIQYVTPSGDVFNIQIDMGKTFRESMLRWYPRFGVPWVDAVVITHDHADAMMGLDDLRSVQRMPDNAKQGQLAEARRDIAATPVFVGARHLAGLHRCFPYLVSKNIENQTVARYVAKIDWRAISDFETFTCPGGLQITTVPVEHGKDYICQAFVFGKGDRIAYLSDVSAVPDDTMAVLEEAPINILIVDCLFEFLHPTHFGLEQAVNLVRRLRPKKALLVGMSDAFEHHATNARLGKLRSAEGSHGPLPAPTHPLTWNIWFAFI